MSLISLISLISHIFHGKELSSRQAVGQHISRESDLHIDGPGSKAGPGRHYRPNQKETLTDV